MSFRNEMEYILGINFHGIRRSSIIEAGFLGDEVGASKFFH
jgi:hypothetical protein